jgi:diguanylate cyclase (GGDEF)-like protein
MYMPWLMCGYAVAVVLLMVGCRIAARTVPGLRGVRLLMGALVCALAGVVLLGLRPWAPGWLTVVLSNQAIFACSLLIYCAVAEALSAEVGFLRWGAALCLGALLGDAWFTSIHPALVPRILIASGLCALYAGVTAALLFRHHEEESDPAAPALQFVTMTLAWLETSLTCLHTTRCVLTVLNPPANFVHLDLIQAAFTYLNLLMNVAAVCGVIWLALGVHRKELQVMARTDGLTGLLNRRAFDDLLVRELRRVESNGGSLGVLLLDIDRFKEVNDRLGHPAGDEVIRRVSAAMRADMWPGDALARFGGEEFVMLLCNRTLEQTEEVGERLRAKIAAFTGLPGGIQVTVSIGVAGNQAGDTVAELLRRCDDALYRSKRGGRNLVTADRPWARHSDISIQPA